LPIGTAIFRDIIKGGYLYIDKTRQLDELVRTYKGVYFLSRPRRFGKSLMISTLSELFHGTVRCSKDCGLRSRPTTGG